MKALKFPLSLILILHFLAGLSGGEEGEGDKELTLEKKLKDKVFKNYDKDLRPVYHHKNETRVFIEIYPRYIVEFDEQKSTLTMDGWIFLHWEDPRLSWNVSDYDGLENLRLADHYIWQPDIYVYNGLSSNVNPRQNSHILVMYDGLVYYVPPCEFKTVCVSDPDGSYPNDIVMCHIVMGSWTHDGNQINLTTWHDDIHGEEYFNSNPSWEILFDKSSLVRHVQYYECCPEPYISVIMTLALKRKTPPELQIVWAPCVVVMLLTLAMFWIPSGSGKKIILGSALFLTLSLLTVYVGAITKSPKAPLLAVRFLQSTMYAVVSAILLEVMILNLSLIVGPCRPPAIIIQFLTGPYAKFLAVWPRWETNVSVDRIQLKEDSEQVERHPTANDEWVLLATVIDRFLFIVYVIILSTIHQI